MPEENGTTNTTTEGQPAGDTSGTGGSWEGAEKTNEGQGENRGQDNTQAEKEAADENHPTKLGRKVKEQGEQIATMLATVQELTNLIKSQNSAPSKEDVSDRYDDSQYDQMVKVAGPPPVETIVTAKDQHLVMEWEKRATNILREKFQENYSKGYFATLNDPDLKEKGGEHHARIVAMVTDPKDKGQKYNKKQTGNPMADAKLNYLEALKDIIAGKSGDDTKNFNKQSPDGTGVTKPDGGVKKAPVSPKLSEAAQGYADYFNMSPEARADALSRKGGVVGRL